MAGAHAHAHPIRADADRRALSIALALILGFMGVEVVVGILASSLALLSDAAHMLTDAGAIALSLVAARLAARPAGGPMTYGLEPRGDPLRPGQRRTLLVLGLLISTRAMHRLFDPPAVDARRCSSSRSRASGSTSPRVAFSRGANRRESQRRGLVPPPRDRPLRVHRHRDRRGRDPGHRLRSCGRDRLAAVAALMLRSAYGLLRASGRVFLEAAPEGVDPSRSATRWPPSPAWSRYTTCTCGR